MAGKWRKNGVCVWWETLCLAQCFEKDDRGGSIFLAFYSFGPWVTQGLTSPSGNFEKFTYLAPGLLLLTFNGLGFDLWARIVPRLGLRACPHHGFSELHQLDTFYNALNVNDQDLLNSTAGGNFLDKMPRECLKIIESKSKVCQSRAKAVVAKVARRTNPQLQFHLLLLLQLKQLSPIVLLEVVLTRTKVVPLQAEMFIVTTSKRSGTLPSNTIVNPKEELKGISIRSGVSYQRPTNSARSKVVKQGTEKFYEIFKDMSFEISFTDALILMPKFASTLKTLIGNKEKLIEMARTPMNEHCSAVILNKLPRKLGDPRKFLIPCEFPRMDEFLALADPGASINLMPFFVSPSPLILGRCFLKTGRALIDVYKGELTLHIRNEAINLDQTVRYSANYNQMTANKIDVICEEYSQEVLGFSDTTASGNPTPYDDPIVSTTSPTLTLFGDSDFLLFEEADAFLGLEDDPDSSKINPFYYDPEGDILLLETILNSEPLPPIPNHEQYLPSYKKELKVCEAKTVKSSVDEPPEVELKDLPPHLEYAFLEGNNKLPVFIAKELGDEEKSALIKDYKPAVQHQRRVNPKIHDVIKKEVEKLLDAGLIYLISDSSWVSPVHCVPKKVGFTVIENEENELIPTRLVTGWRVCIDYCKLNEATRKDHFPLPFMDQMLERLAGNEFYCFLDGFSGYFQIPIDHRDQEKTMFTCPYGTFAYRLMPFGLCNAPGTFQRCMLAIFHDMVEKTMEVFMDDFSVFGSSFENCLSRLDKMLQRCDDTNLSLN
nr:reverse transcriptase domain-containing protein [Tanacetum cinerariifolium]